jgi:hypothetical protein
MRRGAVTVPNRCQIVDPFRRLRGGTATIPRDLGSRSEDLFGCSLCFLFFTKLRPNITAYSAALGLKTL